MSYGESNIFTEILTEEVKPYSIRKEEDIRKAAEEKNCDVVFSDENHLLLDIDSQEALVTFHNSWDELSGSIGGYIESEHASKSGLPKKHIYIKLDKPMPDIWQRIALQMALGSDRIRELMHCREVMYGMENPICLFEPKKVQNG
jgi:hypothetical protein